jgi:hypothetical protein
MKRLLIAIIVTAAILACGPANAAAPAMTQADIDAAYSQGWEAAMRCVEQSVMSGNLPSSSSTTTHSTRTKSVYQIGEGVTQVVVPSESTTTYLYSGDRVVGQLREDCPLPR